MATVVGNEAFVEQLIAEVVQPASERLMEGRYFSALRAGTLTMRQIQGYALQHTWFNRQLLKAGAVRMLRATDPTAFADAVEGIVAEHDHPDLCQEFGLSIGLTDEDFANTTPIFEVLCHTSVIVASSVMGGSPLAGRTSGLTNETMVQRYSTEFFNRLQQAPYDIPAEQLEFFRIHGIVDVDHAASAAEAIAARLGSERDRQLVWDSAETQVRLKLAKFEGLYDSYA